jgi:sulfite reductase alpha subunit-like flavoprotein
MAASRDSPDKVYVQDLIKQDAALIREWLYEKQGWLFVCGSSGAMPKAVREAVAWCVSTEGRSRGEGEGEGEGTGMGMEEADEWVGRMFEEGRGGEESW